jgi:2'-5' RNA ligase superfamily protein
MRPFPPPDEVWPAGETRLHVYAVPDRAANADLLNLVDRARPVCAQFADSNVPVDEEWLHTTVRQIVRDARGVGEHQRRLLAGELAQSVSGLAPFTLIVSGLSVGTGGVLLDLDDDGPGGPWRELSGRVTQAIARVCGPESVTYDPGAPHISVTYCRREIDSGELESALRQHVRPARASFVVREVHLVDVIQDADAHTYTWRNIARVPLGSA